MSPNPQRDYLTYLRQQNVIPPGGSQGPQYAGPGYGSPQPGLGTGDPSLGIGRTQLTPNPPSPGLGTGAPMPRQNEDNSFGSYGNPDPLMVLLAMLMNQRFPNGM